jgi:C-terminal processing protease CtpA/Prc
MRVLLWFALLFFIQPLAAQQDDDQGVQTITGEVNYTVGFLQDFGAGAVTVALVDLGDYIRQSQRADRLPDATDRLSLDEQHLGQVTSNPLRSPFRYRINLPMMPPGMLYDVDQDQTDDPGIALMHVAVFVDMFGDPYWDDRREYAAGFTSTRRSNLFEMRHEFIGGRVLVWSPDAEQGFPAGFGADNLLFTADDPIQIVSPGYTVVNMETEPFTFDRTPEATVTLFEQEQSLQPADYRLLSYDEAFQALINQMRREYAFTTLKDVDWDALYDEFMPRFQQAELDNDGLAYEMALQEFAWAIPDGHINLTAPRTDALYRQQTDGGIGLTIREVEDGRVIVNYLLADSPAARAGIVLGAEVLTINGQALVDRYKAVNVWSGPFSTAHSRRLQELRYAVRFPVGEAVTITYRNPGEDQPQTARMIAIPERMSWDYSSINRGAAPLTALPLEFQLLDNGYGYVRVNTFADDPLLLLRLWEWMIDTLNESSAPGLILDMRWNSGGYNLYNQMASYFFREEIVVGNSARYYDGLDDFYVDPVREERIVPPPDGRHYSGEIAVLVSPACSSACEYFTYLLTLDDRAEIIGHYPTDGLGGSITPVFMPDDVYFQFTVSRALTADGDIRIEGTGVEPTLRVPVTEETLFATEDILLSAALDYLQNGEPGVLVDTGVVTVGTVINGVLSVGSRDRYVLERTDADPIDIILRDETGTLDTVLYLYLEGEADPILSNDDDPLGGTTNSALRGVDLPSDLRLIIEVAGFQDASDGAYILEIRPAE